MGLFDWLRRPFRPNDAGTEYSDSAPAGWTDNMFVELCAGRTVEELVDYVLAARQRGRQNEALVSDLCAEFGLSSEDAELSLDRVGGGVFRARTGDKQNCPDRRKDPIAYASYVRTIGKK